MHAPAEDARPPRSALRRLIRPWEYRHLHAVMSMRFASGGFQLGVGLCVVGLGSKAGTAAERRKLYRIAAWFLVPAVLNLLGGFIDLTVASDRAADS
jgi:hypothetical protein